MRNIIKKFLIIALGYILILGNVVSVHAVENVEDSQNTNTSGVVYKIAAPEEDAILLNTNTIFQNDSKITTTTYQLSDGSIVTDTLNEGILNARSSSGSDVVTRSKTKSGWGTLTITAYFDWYTKTPFSYVRCSSMSSSFVADSSYSVGISGEITESYTSDYVSIGKAHATASCTLYRYYLPSVELNDISLTIECSDEGTISDR